MGYLSLQDGNVLWNLSIMKGRWRFVAAVIARHTGQTMFLVQFSILGIVFHWCDIPLITLFLSPIKLNF